MMDNRRYQWIEYDGDGAVVERESKVVEIDPIPEAEAALLGFGASKTGAIPPPDNTKEWWILFLCRIPSPRWQWPIGVKWVKEVAEPWRAGWGLAVRLGARTVVGGIWRKGPIPGTPHPGGHYRRFRGRRPQLASHPLQPANTPPTDLVIR